jgi:hypothetical protein
MQYRFIVALSHTRAGQNIDDDQYMKLVKERGWQTIELNVISQRTYNKFIGLMNIADVDFWTNLEK